MIKKKHTNTTQTQLAPILITIRQKSHVHRKYPQLIWYNMYYASIFYNEYIILVNYIKLYLTGGLFALDLYLT